ncbi:hypothetical protein [Micromonospora sp. NPDC050200]|uniref:hypothetical protein n=1 Tax=Micromonospora sp. NPDC050200 TaxID=3155664 RepID=UPI003401930A
MGETDFDEPDLMDRLIPRIDGTKGPVQRFLFSRSRFSGRLRAFAAEESTVTLVTAADIYA